MLPAHIYGNFLTPAHLWLLCMQILVIAVLMKWVLARTFSMFQWEALLLLVAGITVNQLNYCKCARSPSGLSRF